MASEKTIGRIQAQIQRRAAHCLQHEIADPRASFVTITKVELSPDLTQAKISYSVLGDETDLSKTQHMLDHAAGYIQRQVGSILRMRRIPNMRWVYDDSIAEAARLDRLIQETIERDAAIRGGRPGVPTDGAPEEAQPDTNG
ncbi:MAG: 30S ribosome-binding factor RbfA [Planctomycetes bacterium]|nr:30S ribosome-binding factor RbfA [Planctomycetota bacterium]MCB9911113.1 30S ribosome-binding factor RbfA [Planctomycetota bacterium]MCB9912154.1 30S ribosome-binding factor RbfA [Planctomycetota bacterium]HPF12834.1 30S ribosome-binding factor RbfA [Planctomycetota bacterium]HRV80608.1 30S ribosome-binding factor RbfA [Planctomycetota bacterium]